MRCRNCVVLGIRRRRGDCDGERGCRRETARRIGRFVGNRRRQSGKGNQRRECHAAVELNGVDPFAQNRHRCLEEPVSGVLQRDNRRRPDHVIREHVDGLGDRARRRGRIVRCREPNLDRNHGRRGRAVDVRDPVVQRCRVSSKRGERIECDLPSRCIHRVGAFTGNRDRCLEESVDGVLQLHRRQVQRSTDGTRGVVCGNVQHDVRVIRRRRGIVVGKRNNRRDGDRQLGTR